MCVPNPPKSLPFELRTQVLCAPFVWIIQPYMTFRFEMCLLEDLLYARHLHLEEWEGRERKEGFAIDFRGNGRV